MSKQTDLLAKSIIAIADQADMEYGLLLSESEARDIARGLLDAGLINLDALDFLKGEDA